MPNTAVLGEDNEKQLEEWIAEYSAASQVHNSV